MGGLNDFIFFNAHFLSVNVFQGEGVLCTMVFLDGVGINPGKQTVYHIRPGYKRYTVGGIWGG